MTSVTASISFAFGLSSLSLKVLFSRVPTLLSIALTTSSLSVSAYIPRICSAFMLPSLPAFRTLMVSEAPRMGYSELPGSRRSSKFLVSGRTFFFVRVCVIGLLVTSLANRPVKPIIVFFFVVVLIILFILCALVYRATSPSIRIFRGQARGNGPADRGRRRRLASSTISDFTFGPPAPPFFCPISFFVNNY
jgi:hypothetical protein